MKRLFIISIAAAALLAACKKAEPVKDDSSKDNSSEAYVATKISDFEKIYPSVTRAGFSKSKKYVLDMASACMLMSEKEEGNVDLQLEYVWKYYDKHVDLNIKVSDAPFQLSEDGRFTIEAQNLSGSVTYVDVQTKEWGWTVETVFSVEAVISDKLEDARLSLESDEICLDVDGFAPKAEVRTGTWAITEWQDVKIERFVNLTNDEITIDLGELKVVGEGYHEYELSAFTLASGQAKEIEYDSWKYPMEGYYYGLPTEISVEYSGNIYTIKRDTLVPTEEKYAEELGRTIWIPKYEMDWEPFHDLMDGFLSLGRWPIYIYRITPEALGL